MLHEDHLSKYSVGEVIGHGSYGAIHKATRCSDGVVVVVKKLRINNISHDVHEKFHQEVELLSHLVHPGIVQFHEAFLDDTKEYFCIVMGYCGGGDLQKLFESEKNATENQCQLPLLVQLVLALDYMHSQNVLHRDLKPMNIFIKGSVSWTTPTSNNKKVHVPVLKLGDFGISKVLDTSEDFAQTCIGTPYFMSPEQFQGCSYNHKSDMWSLGCVLYELVTGEQPFDGRNLSDLANKICNVAHRPLPPNTPSHLVKLIDSLLLKNPVDRPSTRDILKQQWLQPYIVEYVKTVFTDKAADDIEMAHLMQQVESIGTVLPQQQLPKIPPIKDVKRDVPTRRRRKKLVLQHEERMYERLQNQLQSIRNHRRQRHKVAPSTDKKKKKKKKKGSSKVSVKKTPPRKKQHTKRTDAKTRSKEKPSECLPKRPSEQVISCHRQWLEINLARLEQEVCNRNSGDEEVSVDDDNDTFLAQVENDFATYTLELDALRKSTVGGDQDDGVASSPRVTELCTQDIVLTVAPSDEQRDKDDEHEDEEEEHECEEMLITCVHVQLQRHRRRCIDLFGEKLFNKAYTSLNDCEEDLNSTMHGDNNTVRMLFERNGWRSNRPPRQHADDSVPHTGTDCLRMMQHLIWLEANT